MAEVVAAIAQPICEFGRCLWIPIAKRINYVKNLSKNWENLCKKISELGTKRDDIDAQIEQAKPDKIPTRECEEWKKNVEEMEKNVTIIKPEFEDEKKCLRGLCPDIFVRMKFGGQVVNMICEVEELLKKSKFEIGFLINSPPLKVEKKLVPDLLTASASNTLRKVLDKIRDKTTPKIGICGMGGIGKTTILLLLNNNPEIIAMFDFYIWMTVSKSWNIGKIQEEVGKRLSIDTTNESNERVASKLSHKLEGKKYLLLLDDVWEKVNLRDVGFPNANRENGCKVVLTTRTLEVCRKMGTNHEINVEVFPEKEAWEMFNSKVDNVAESPTIRQHAEEIVKKCGGLPLALKVVGGALRKKTNENFWRQFLSDLKSPAETSIKDIEEEVFKPLKVSYDYLTDIEKNCLLFCGLYPEDNEIKKSKLLGYWRAEGLLSGKLTLADARVKGDVILEALIDASLLEKGYGDDDNDYVKMHDVVRDLVLAMTSPKGEERSHLVRAGTSTEKMPEDEEWKKATRISFIDNQHFSNLPKSPDCPMLSTLLLQRCSNIEVISESFFNNMPTLYVLDLSHTSIKSLPVSISKLVTLRELLLNSCSNLNVLPVELSELKSLEVLEVTKAKLNRLPIWIFELINLKRLKIKDMKRSDDNFVDSEQVLVPGLISKTSQMEEFCVLNFLYNFGLSDKSEDIVASELSSFSSLSSLDIKFLSASNLQYFLQNSRSWRERKLTKFRFCISPREMIWGLPRYKKSLKYEGGRGEDHSILPWAIEDVLSRSNSFELVGHGELTTLSDLGTRNTYELKFCLANSCNMLENVVNRNGLEMDAFRNLEALQLNNLENLKCILEMEGPPPPPSLVSNSFTNLTKLYLRECPMIKHVFSNGFMIQQLSNLEDLDIRDCSGLEGMLSEDENVEYEALPKLKRVQLWNLPEFVSFFKGVAMCWKSLERVYIINCSKLRKLPLDVNSATNLKRIQVNEGNFWDALEWDNNATKLRFQPLVSGIVAAHYRLCLSF
ncbi:probable disease resistance protein At4g27220 isoform X1 [Actinidia eriantha]|uniref:probable disease resistance protein At4g27220 isoform X1 n=1 Tax=Actinidia eriantha TaxID=165200 RepID=UPI0025906FEA|nr:probable disease resistance protein At4g27220 isoform X1 [Actinidia eriantha]XP_057486207.1 probable disease resistance protein At4g27220 isoform X2 [Actinidia eriantha]XP_057486208.1 probable disease resistance protein At4g27220 isoform X1 [Actinidia eriantha]